MKASRQTLSVFALGIFSVAVIFAVAIMPYSLAESDRIPAAETSTDTTTIVSLNDGVPVLKIP